MQHPRWFLGLAVMAAMAFALACTVPAPGGAGTTGTPAAGDAGTEDLPTVAIGSADFAENALIAEIYAQALEAEGFGVERRFNLGAREILVPAIESGEFDLYPEYIASLVTFVTEDTEAASTDTQETLDALAEAIGPMGLSVLDASPGRNVNGFVVTREFAEENDLTSVSDLANLDSFVLGGPPECPEREFCQLGLEDVYGIEVGEFRSLDVGGPITVQALESGEIDVAVLFTTDAQIAARDFVLLEDNEGLQLADAVAPVLTTELLEGPGGDTLAATLNEISAGLTTDALISLNQETGIDRVSDADAAAAWLEEQGIVAQ